MDAINATYKDGVFLPDKPLDLPEGVQVTLWIDPSAREREHLTEEDRQFFQRLATQRQEVFRRLAE